MNIYRLAAALFGVLLFFASLQFVYDTGFEQGRTAGANEQKVITGNPSNCRSE